LTAQAKSDHVTIDAWRIRVLFSEEAIARRNRELAAQIVKSAPRNLLVIAILRGSFIFAADLVRQLHEAGLAPSIEFMQLASYHSGTVSSGQVTVVKDIDNKVDDRDVLLIDDIPVRGRFRGFPRARPFSGGLRDGRRASIAPIALHRRCGRRSLKVR